ncbi:enoyl-CoA hydratase, partial [Paenibacillus phytohabitans]
GIISAAVSKYLPGPGSHILKQEIEFLLPLYHYDTVQFLFEVTKVNFHDHTVEISVTAFDEGESRAIEGKLLVCPP